VDATAAFESTIMNTFQSKMKSVLNQKIQEQMDQERSVMITHMLG